MNSSGLTVFARADQLSRCTDRRGVSTAWFWLLLLLTFAGASELTAQTVTRGPYLQLGTPSEITVRWRTDVATNSRVRYGAAPGSLTTMVDDAVATTEHEVQLSGLAANTTYFYSVGSTTAELAGNDATHLFVTAPMTGTPKATRVWVLGDSGTADANAGAVRDAYLAFTGGVHTDLWLMLGDNAYEDGTDAEFQAAVFDTYPSVLRKSVLWPTFGNHDGNSSFSATQTGPYYDIHTLPTAAEAGGVLSGTEAYYSFDYGNIHFICLDSFETDRSVGMPMMVWLEDDLMATSQDWIVAFWHHPPYSKGSHDSDVDIELIEMRENALPLLEAGGVDLVLAGHSHSYERSFLLDGHYGMSGTLVPGTMVLDGGDGRVGGDGAYVKSTLGPAANDGAVHVVTGNAGRLRPGLLNHPVMFLSVEVLGSVVLDFEYNRLDVTHINSTGGVVDTFTILKDPQPAPAAPTGLVVSDGDTSALLDWVDNAEPDLVGYRVHRATTTGGPYTRIDNAPDESFLPPGASLRYDDTGTDLGTAWKEPGFDDSAWATGAAELGYGDGDEATLLSFGSDANNKFPTYYFRGGFQVTDPSRFDAVELRMKRDDGAVVYLNGVEVVRSNMPMGPITYNTFSATGVGIPVENQYLTFALSASTLVAGTNVLAVEVHQVTAVSSDMSLDLELTGKVAELVASSQFEDSSAVSGIEYFYVVTAVNTADAESVNSVEFCTVLGIPEAPAPPVATPGDFRVDLDWGDSPECDLDGYNVYRALAPEVPVTTPLNPTPLASSDFADLGLLSGTTYYYVVTAVDLDGRESVASVEVFAAPTGVDLVPPLITLVQVTDVTDVGARVIWTTDELADSVVDYGLDAMYGSVATDPANTLAHVIDLSSLSANQLYHYRVTSTDGSGNSSSTPDGTLTFMTLPPNEAPTAESQTVTTGEDVSVGITLAANDPESSPLIFMIVDPPSNGTLTGTPPNVVYAPDAEFSGSDSFTFTANDGQSDSNLATVTITVTAIDDPPVADPQSVTTDQDVSVGIVLTASDVEGQTLSFSVVDPPSSGGLSGTEPNLTYTPNGGFSGSDSFTFQANDGTTDSNIATVTITVISIPLTPPVVGYFAFNTGTVGGLAVRDEDIVSFDGAAFSMEFDGSDVGVADLALDAFDIISSTEILMSFAVSGAVPGVGTVDDSDVVRFTATELGEVTSGTFDLYFDGSDVGLTLNSEDIDALTLRDDGTLLVSLLGSFTVSGLSGGDEDILAFSPTSTGSTTAGTWTMYFDGTDVGLDQSGEDIDGLALDAEDAVMLSVRWGFSVSGLSGANEDVFRFVPTTLGAVTTGSFDSPLFFDGTLLGVAGSNDLTGLDVPTTPPNAAPQAVVDSYSVPEDGTLNEPALTGVLWNDTDAESDPLTAHLATNVSDGTLTLASDGSFTYTPDPDFSGVDQFTYLANDGTSDSAPGTVTITVTGENDPPVAQDQPVTTPEDVPVAVTLVATDVDGDTLTYIVGTPSNGGLTGTAPAFTYTPNGDFSGADSFTFHVDDGQVDSNTATVSITVSAVNDPPVADPLNVATDEDTPVGVTLTGSDVEGAVLTFSVAASPGNGVLSGTAPSLTYTPNADFEGADSFTYVANDGGDDSLPATVSITVSAVNDPPVGDPQDVNTLEDTAIPVTLTGSDVDGDSLTFNVLTNPSQGVLSGLAPNLTYTPNTGVSGTPADSFTFEVNDGSVPSAPATVTINVTEVSDPPTADDQPVSTDEDVAVAVTLTASDPEGDPLTFSVVTPPANGGLSGTEPNLTYTPDADFNGADSFTFMANDGQNDSNLATVTITVNPLNDPPVADGQPVGTDEDLAIGITLTGSDVDGDLLSFTVVAPPTNGVLSGTEPNLTYTPNGDFNGTDDFTFMVNDGQVDSTDVTVSITVNPLNDPPVAVDQPVMTDEDTGVAMTLTASDVDGDALTFSLVGLPANGNLTGVEPNLTYTPDADFNGADSFTFVANDGQSDSNLATVTITVTAIDDPPVADPQSVTTDQDVSVGIVLTASDAEGQTLSFSVVDPPSSGGLSGTEPNLTYTPNAGFSGSDSFTFQANDGTTDSNIATVTITVISIPLTPPVVGYFAFNTGTVGGLAVRDEDIVSFDGAAFSMEFDGSDVGVADLALDAFDIISATEILMSFAVSGAVPGVGTVDDSDVVRFTATELGEVTSGTFDLYFDGSDVGLTLNSEDIDALTLRDDGTLLVSLLGSFTVSGLSGGDEDILAFSPTSTGSTTAGTWTMYFDGTDVGLDQSGEDIDGLALDAEDAVMLSVRWGFSVSGLSGANEDVFRFVPTTLGAVTTGSFDSPLFFDGTLLGVAGSNDLTGLDVPTTPPNAAPQAVVDSYSVPEDGTLNEPALTGVLWNDTDAESDPLTAHLATDVSNGTLTLASDGSFTYTPDPDFSGVDQFTYLANDGTSDSAPGTVTITVSAVNDPPVGDPQDVNTLEDTAVAVTLTGSDVDGDSLTFNVLTSPTQGLLSGLAPNLTYTPNTGVTGTPADSFTFEVNDGSVPSAPATVTINVTEVSDPPTADDQPVSTDEDVAVAVTLTASDPEGDPLTFSVVTPPANGGLSGTEPNLTYTPDADFNGADSFTFVANDGQNDSNLATVTITVTAIDDPPVADPQSVTTDQDVSIGIVLTASDAEGQTLSYSVVDPPSSGGLSGTEPNLTYTPNGGFSGSDSFTFQANDGTTDSNIATVTITVISIPLTPPVVGYFAFNTGTVGGLAVRDEDIVSFDGTAFSMEFDGSDVGVADLALDAFDIISSTEILMSFATSGAIPGVGTVDDSDVVRFTATELGEVTSGTFDLYFDGSDVGLTLNSEDIDALTLRDDGTLLVSLLGSFTVSGVSGGDEDILAFSATSTGSTTAGTWTMYFDGTDVGLDQSGEDIDGLALDAEDAVMLSVRWGFSVSGLSGANEDVFRFVPTTLGAVTTGSFDPTLFLDGSALGFASSIDVSGLDIPR